MHVRGIVPGIVVISFSYIENLHLQAQNILIIGLNVNIEYTPGQ